MGGLADWLRTDSSHCRSPPPMITTVTAVCIRPAGAALSVRGWGETQTQTRLENKTAESQLRHWALTSS